MPVALRSLSRKPKAPPKPESDPRFAKVVEDLKRKAAKVKQHPTPAKKAAEAQAAAKGPPNEKAAGGKAKQVDKIKEAKTKKPEPDSFLALLRAEIQKAMPQTLDDAQKFMKGGQASAMKGSLKGNVNQQKTEATGDVAAASKQSPGEAGPGKQATPIPSEAQPPAPDVNAPAAMPAPKSAGDVSLQDSKQDTEAAMKDAEVTPDQLKKANDPRFSAVLTAKDTVAKQADTAPNQFRGKEKSVLTNVSSQAKTAANKGAAAMLGTKTKSKSAVQLKQEATKKKDEDARKKVADDIEAIYTKTKTKVEAKLTSLETEVGAIFDSGTDAALAAMKSFVEDKLFNYKLKRYLSIPVVGAARWIADQFKGLPDEVNVFYVEGRNLFAGMMDAVVVRVANLVETRLAEAKALVAAGQAEIKTYVAGLAPNLRSVGESAQKEVAGRFTELEKGIDDKKNELAQSLAAKYKEAFDKADQALKDIQDANKGLVAAFVEKLGEIIKILAEFKDKLMAILRKGADTIKLILADPIGFLGNLIGAIKAGISGFVGNIWTHLKAGFMKWLFGALGGAGIAIPADLSLPSILKLALDVLGITYERMRAKAVKLIGERNVSLLERLYGYVQELITGGPAALWAKIKQDLSDLKAMVIDAIQDWLVSTVIKAAVSKLLTMFNPAGAIVQAVIAIYNTVMFLIERASQIMEFVEAVINSIHAIATGSTGAAAAAVERALANAIPIVIGFLAALIGLGGIGAKIKSIIMKVQAKVDQAIDKAIAKIVALVKKLFGGGGGKDKKPLSEKERAEQIKKGVAALGALTQKFSKKGATQKQVEAGAKKVKAKYSVFESVTAVAQGEKWVFEYVASPKKQAPGPKKGTPTFSLAPGPLKLQDTKILTANKKVHLYMLHGPAVLEGDVEQRLKDELARFKSERAKKFVELEKSIDNAQAELAKLSKGTPPTNPEKIEKRAKDIARYTEQMEAALSQKKKYSGINEKDRAAIQRALADLDKKTMPKAQSTKFTVNDELLDSIIREALNKKENQDKINKAFIDEDGNARAKGTTTSISHKAGQNIGMGYEMDERNKIIKIQRALSSLNIVPAISDPDKFEYVVLTAHPK